MRPGLPAVVLLLTFWMFCNCTPDNNTLASDPAAPGQKDMAAVDNIILQFNNGYNWVILCNTRGNINFLPAMDKLWWDVTSANPA